MRVTHQLALPTVGKYFQIRRGQLHLFSGWPTSYFCQFFSVSKAATVKSFGSRFFGPGGD